MSVNVTPLVKPQRACVAQQSAPAACTPISQNSMRIEQVPANQGQIQIGVAMPSIALSVIAPK